MDIIKDEGVIPFHPFYEWNGTIRGTGNVILIYYTHAFYHDGFKFVFGSMTKGKIDRLVEVTTAAAAVSFEGDTKKLKSKDVKKLLLDEFFRKLENSRKTIGEVVRDYELRLIELGGKFDVETWLINSLII